MSSTPTMITPTDEQQQAINKIIAWWTAWHLTGGLSQQEFILDGGAGTGKSTIAGLAAQALRLKNIVPAAYTAKAAKVMRDKGLKDASTLHRLLYVHTGRTNGNLNWAKLSPPDSPVYKCDMVILDECSMAPEDIANDLRSYGKPILVLGDIDGQLPPPKGVGAFIGRQPDFRLTEPHRTVANSPIGRLAWIVRKGGSLRADMLQWDGATAKDDQAAMVKSMLWPGAWDLLTSTEWQAIVGKNNNRRAVINKFREKHGFVSMLPEIGESLVCCKNNYRLGLINGDTGIVTQLYNEEWRDCFIADVEIAGKGLFKRLHIWTGLFTPGQPYPSRTDMAEFDWSYALTAHKAQGSEYDNVVVVDDKFGIWDNDLRRRWLYTAVTRARKRLVVLQAGR